MESSNKKDQGSSKQWTVLDDKSRVDPCQQIINYGEEDQMEIEGYKKSLIKTVLTWLLTLLTVGILRLLFHWFPRLQVYATHFKCPIKNADKFVIKEDFQKKHRRYYVKSCKTLCCDAHKIPADHKGRDEVDGAKLTIPKPDGSIKEQKEVRAFKCQKLCYIWDDESEQFTKLKGIENPPMGKLHELRGLTPFQEFQRRLLFNSNETKVKVQSIFKILSKEVLNPFYIFQVFSVTVWMTEGQYWIGIGIFLMSAFGIIATIFQTRKNQRQLRETVEASSDMVTVSRGPGEYETVPSKSLVPGDVIVIPPGGCSLNCDAVLLSGNCIVNESLLTGESVPVTKTPVPNREDTIFDIIEHARHTLFSGTNVMQTRPTGKDKTLAAVIRTGFLTTKGNLVRSILYPPPGDFKFERGSYKFMGLLIVVALFGFAYSIYMKIKLGADVKEIILDLLDLITVVVPPALPAAVTVGKLYAQRRLKKVGIYCISPKAINVSGSIDCVCFDKTGTLTEEGMDVWGVLPTQSSSAQDSTDERAPNNMIARIPSFSANIREKAKLLSGKFVNGMAACHSLTRIHGHIVGDPLDVKMFEWTGWDLEEPDQTDNNNGDIPPTIARPQNNKDSSAPGIGIVRQFPFESSLQRMSVITRELDSPSMDLYAKGSPEMISSLSFPHTVPPDFKAILNKYTSLGYRVIALGHRTLERMSNLEVQEAEREEVERDLTFLGLIILENRLKRETAGVVEVLKKAAMRTVMVTGDNLITALSVAQESGMLGQSEKVIIVDVVFNDDDAVPEITYNLANTTENPQGTKSLIIGDEISYAESPENRYHFALNGNAFQAIKTHHPEVMAKIAVRGAIFARMSPQHKQQLVQYLQELGYFVGMCGDGANDCAALKTAHAGIALSEEVASVASPFTSKQGNIGCVPDLIQNGRGALVTSFGIFKFMGMYSFIQFVACVVLYSISNNLSDLEFFYQDMLLIANFSLFFGRTGADEGPLKKRAPSASLVSWSPIISLALHMITALGFQLLAFFYVQTQPWFEAYQPDPEHEEVFKGSENYSLFLMSSFQYIIMAIVFSRGRPYRKKLWTNILFLISLLVMTALTMFLGLYPIEWIEDHVQIQLPPDRNFSWIIIGFVACNFLVAIGIEEGIVNWLLGKKFDEFLNRRRTNGLKYTQIENDLKSRVDWPPLNNND